MVCYNSAGDRWVNLQAGAGGTGEEIPECELTEWGSSVDAWDEEMSPGADGDIGRTSEVMGKEERELCGRQPSGSS